MCPLQIALASGMNSEVQGFQFFRFLCTAKLIQHVDLGLRTGHFNSHTCQINANF